MRKNVGGKKEEKKFRLKKKKRKRCTYFILTVKWCVVFQHSSCSELSPKHMITNTDSCELRAPCISFFFWTHDERYLYAFTSALLFKIRKDLRYKRPSSAPSQYEKTLEYSRNQKTMKKRPTGRFVTFQFHGKLGRGTDGQVGLERRQLKDTNCKSGRTSKDEDAG